MTDPAACPDAENANGLITYKHKFYLHRNLAFTFAQSVQIALKQDGQKSCSESKLCSSLINSYVTRFNDDISPSSPIAKIIGAITKNAATYPAPYNDKLFQDQIGIIAKNYKTISGYTKADFESKFSDTSFKSLNDMLTVYDGLNRALHSFQLFYYSTCAMQAKVLPYPCPNDEDMFTLLSSREVISSYKHHYLFQGVASAANACSKDKSLTSPFTAQLKNMITSDLAKKGIIGTSITNLYNTEDWPAAYEDIQRGIVPFYRNFQDGITIKDLSTGCFDEFPSWTYASWNWSDFEGFVNMIDQFNAAYTTACCDSVPYERLSSKNMNHFFELHDALMEVKNLHFAFYTIGQIQPLLNTAKEKRTRAGALLGDIFSESFGTEEANLKDGSFVTVAKKLANDINTYPTNLQSQIGAIATASAKLSTYCKPNSECNIFLNAATLSTYMEDLISKTDKFLNQAFMAKLIVQPSNEQKKQAAPKEKVKERQASLTNADVKKALPKDEAKEKSPAAAKAPTKKAEKTKGTANTEASNTGEIPDCSIQDIVEQLFAMTHEKHWLLMSKSKMKESVAPLAAQLKDKKLQGDLKEVQENIEKISKIGLSIGELTLTTGPIGLLFGVFKIFKAAYDIRSTIVDVKKLTDLVCKPKTKEEDNEK